jgi:hypothetical protein
MLFGCHVFGMDGSAIDSVSVTSAINKGIAHLKKQQKQDGQWQYEIAGHTVGATAMCVIAFIEAGVSRDDSSLIRGVQALRRYRAGDNIHDTYPIAIQTIALTRWGDSSDKPILERNVDWLVRHQVNDGSNGDGGWQYSSGHYSTFETYYVGLALYEAEQSGVAVPREVLEKIRRFWERTQNADGSWGYRPLAKGSGNAYSCTTNAGIISLILSTGFNDSGRFRVEGERINCGRFDPYNISARIELALTSLDNPLISQQIPATGVWSAKSTNSAVKIREMRWVHYNLFAVENVGRFLGRSDIGQCDWYREGTLSLLDQLREHRDYWADSSGETILETSCAVSFLAKGRRPVTIAKVSNSYNSIWNQHPYDVDHLLQFVGEQWNFPLGWRHVELGMISVDDLIQSPVLYFSGDKMPFGGSDAEKKRVAVKLRDYLNRGGFIVAEALSEGNEFEAGFRELMKLVFKDTGKDSGGDVNLELLESSHPIWSCATLIQPEQQRPIKGITAACRTNVIFIPAVKGQPSLSCLWEISRLGGRNDFYSAAVRRRVEVGLGIGLNILTYAIDSERRYRDQVAESVSSGTRSQLVGQRGGIFLGILSNGEANATPRALPNLLKWIESNLGLSVSNEVRSIGFDSAMFSYPVLFMFGRKAFNFSPRQREMLRNYLDRGGFLFVNSICSSKQFTDSFEEEMKQIFPNSQLQLIPQDDILFSDNLGGFKINSVEIRQRNQSPNQETFTNSHNEKPQLYGIRSNASTHHWSIIFSPTDLLCPLESPTFPTCRTHSPTSAIQLTTNFILYTLSPH